MEKELVIGLLVVAAFVGWALLELWWWFGRPWSAGEDLKDEMVRQYGAAKTWRYLFCFVLVMLAIWVAMTGTWSPE